MIYGIIVVSSIKPFGCTLMWSISNCLIAAETPLKLWTRKVTVKMILLWMSSTRLVICITNNSLLCFQTGMVLINTILSSFNIWMSIGNNRNIHTHSSCHRDFSHFSHPSSFFFLSFSQRSHSPLIFLAPRPPLARSTMNVLIVEYSFAHNYPWFQSVRSTCGQFPCSSQGRSVKNDAKTNFWGHGSTMSIHDHVFFKNLSLMKHASF